MLIGRGIKVKEYTLQSEGAEYPVTMSNKIFLVLKREEGAVAIETGVGKYKGVQVTSKDNPNISKFPIVEVETGKILYLRDTQVYGLTCDLEDITESKAIEITKLDFSIDLYELAKKKIALAIDNDTIEEFDHLEDFLEVLTPKYNSTYELFEDEDEIVI